MIRRKGNDNGTFRFQTAAPEVSESTTEKIPDTADRVESNSPESAKPEIFASPENGAGSEKWSLLEGTDNICRWLHIKCIVRLDKEEKKTYK